MAASVVTIQTASRRPIVVLLEDRLELGRDCDGLLVADARMSRRHLALEPSPDGTVLVSDLGSSNGTTIDGEAVHHPVAASAGAVVRAGNTEIRIGGPRDAAGRPRAAPAEGTLMATSIDVVVESAVGEISADAVGIRDVPGTLTIVFTDIEGSTDLAVALGDEQWFEVVREHQRHVSTQVAAGGGRVVQSMGDGFMVRFPSARQALLFGIALQRDLEAGAAQAGERAFRVRIGMHTGEVMVDDTGDLIGQHVVVAARIANLADGGQILVSSLVKQIAEPRGDLAFVAPREEMLKGIQGAQVVYELAWRGFAG